jgi:hypothetical protein
VRVLLQDPDVYVTYEQERQERLKKLHQLAASCDTTSTRTHTTHSGHIHHSALDWGTDWGPQLTTAAMMTTTSTPQPNIPGLVHRSGQVRKGL